MSASLVAPTIAVIAPDSQGVTDMDGELLVVGSGAILPHERNQKSILDATERADLARLVGRFKKIQDTWYEGLEILLEIRERRLYRQDHIDFESFCRKVFGMGKSNLNRILQTAEVAKRLATIVAKPERESHVRPLLKLTDTDQQVDCYRAACDAAQNAKRPMNAEDVTKAVRAKLPPRSSTSGTPSELTAADIIRRLGRSLIRNLERYPVDVLVRFEEKLERFKDGWFAENLPSLRSLIPVIDTNDTPNLDRVAETVAAINLSPPEPATPVGEQEQPINQHASTLAVQLGSENYADEGSHAPRSQDRLQEIDHTPRPRTRYDVIALDLALGATCEELKALRLHRLMQNRCHVLIKLNGNPSQLVEDAFAGSVRQVHGSIRLEPLVVTDQGQEKRAGSETVVVVLNGYSKIKGCIPAEVTCTIADNEQWLEAVLDHHSELFPAGLRKKILSLNGTSDSTPAALPRDAIEDRRTEGDMAQSTEADEAANHEGGGSSHE